MVLLEDLNGLVEEDPASAAFCFLGVIPSFSFKAGERMEANDENIFNVQSLGWIFGRTEAELVNTIHLSDNQRRGLTIFTLNKNDIFIMTFYQN